MTQQQCVAVLARYRVSHAGVVVTGVASASKVLISVAIARAASYTAVRVW